MALGNFDGVHLGHKEIQQTIFPFKVEITKVRLTAHLPVLLQTGGGLALIAEFNPP
ncbi:MAG: hypothetical protein HY578_09575 [Nitrospinae bacterium]|nr:hypothetical protein [Nitrospinota bacterium]